jgi:sigma-B regulation protein RsbU (phosphoserine phosphatase)
MVAASDRPISTRVSIPSNIHTSCDFVQTLMKLQRAAQLITSTLDLDSLLDRVVNDIADSIGCVEVSVWLRDRENDEMVLHGIRGCTVHHKGSRLKIGRQGMVGHVASTGKMRYARDVRVDPYYVACELDTRSSVNLPLKARGEVIGVLGVDHHEPNAFSGDQLQVFKALAGHISVAIENARLFQQERAERELMQVEAEDARVVQQALFPKATPLVPGFAFETAWHPAGSLTGDWFDFIDLGEDRYGIVLADVSGKGMPAALLMSATRAILRSVAKLDSSPSQTLVRVNQALADDLPMGKFVTMIYAVLDARSREITVASAGHLRPLLINGGTSFLEVDTGLPLGLGASSYPEYTIGMKPGTQLLFYTDGITEAENVAGEEYGPARLTEHFLRPNACVEGLIEEVQRHRNGAVRSDDATAVLIRSW